MKKCIFEQKKRGEREWIWGWLWIGNCGKVVAIERKSGGYETEK
jgi:hypothetical protein